MPFLKNVRTVNNIKKNNYPFTIPALSQGLNMDFTSNVTFLVGENGSGKSTILEAIATQCGFNLSGGSRNHTYQTQETESSLSAVIKLSWLPKVTNGFFMRAESFFNFATYIDQLAADDPTILGGYGGKSLHQQSHGESFLALFSNRFNKGLYILDEPEAALSPQRQLSFMAIMHNLESSGKAQFLIATHSPILLCYPKAVIYSLDDSNIHKVSYQETEHYKLTKAFLESPDRFLQYLFSNEKLTS